MYKVSHHFSEITFQNESDIQMLYLENKLIGKFLVKNTAPDVIMRYHGISIDSLRLPDMSMGQETRITECVRTKSWEINYPLLHSPAVWELLENRLNRPKSVSIDLQPNSLSVLDFDLRELDMFYTHGEQERRVAEGQVAPALYATFLPLFSATMVHSSGLIINNRTSVFLAPDEGGKSTVVGQAPTGTVVLCDDQVVLRKQGEAFMAYGSPWGLITDQFQTAKLGGFFLLEQAKQFKLIPVKPAVVFDYLWNEHEHYRFFLPKNLRVQAFNLLYDACHQAPCYRMRFPKDYVNWDAIDYAME